MAWTGWIAAILLVIAGGLYLSLRYALGRNSVAVLDWADAALRSGGTVRLVETAQYGPDPAQKVRVFLPAGASAPLPVVVFVHGGSWASGSPDDYTFVARAIAPRGYVVVLAGYRLYPSSRFPGMVEDTASAVRWTRDHAAGLGGDPARIVLMGHSAGAYNAAMAVLDRRYLGHLGMTDHAIRGVVGLAGPYDFYPFTSPATRDSFGDAPHPEATQPLRYVRADVPPMLLLTGADDTTVRPRNSLNLAKALTAAGAPTTAQVFPDMSHTGILMALARPFSRDGRVLDAVLPFLARVTAPQREAASAGIQAEAGKPRP